MKTLLSSSPSPLYLSNSTPWKPKSPRTTTQLVPRASQSPNQTKRAQIAKANAKGFPGTPAPTMKEKSATQNSDKGTSSGADDEIPRVVFDRMIVRILVSVGAPLATGLTLLKFFEIVKEKGLWDIPIWVPLLTTLLTFGVSAFGIAYGALSSSWDVESNGSVLGLEEAQKNWVDMWREEDESNG